MSSESNKINLEAIKALATSDPKLYEAIKSHFSASSPESTSVIVEEGRSTIPSRRFSLDSLQPSVAEIMSLFDFDGNGKVTLDEVRQGAQELKASRKKNKIAIWAMVVQFLVYAALTAGSCGVLYHFLYLMKDTTVNAETGTLMVKGSDDKEVEVSVKSRGETFSYDTTVIDPITGEEKGCVSSSQAAEMFERVLEGTTLKFVEEDITTGAVNVVSFGTNSSVWTDSIIDLGGLVLVPDVDCSEGLAEEEESGDGNRFLSVKDVYDAHIASRETFMLQHFGSTTMGRRLEDVNMYETLREFGYTKDKVIMAFNECMAKRSACESEKLEYQIKAFDVDIARYKADTAIRERDNARLDRDNAIRDRDTCVKERDDAREKCTRR